MARILLIGHGDTVRTMLRETLEHFGHAVIGARDGTEVLALFQHAAEGLARAIPPSWIEGLTASGTPDEVVQRVERYREAGVTLPILRPAARHQTSRVIDLFAPR